MSIKKISTILCAFVIMFAVSERAEAAAIDSTAWGYSDTFKGWGAWVFTTDDKGNKQTVWIGEDGTVTTKPGHGRFATDSTQWEPVDIVDPNPPGGLPPGGGCLECINMYAKGSILSLNSDQMIHCTLVETSSGKIVKTFTVDGEANIPISDLPKNRVYSILFANDAGETSGKTFILDDNNITYISE